MSADCVDVFRDSQDATVPTVSYRYHDEFNIFFIILTNKCHKITKSCAVICMCYSSLELAAFYDTVITVNIRDVAVTKLVRL